MIHIEALNELCFGARDGQEFNVSYLYDLGLSCNDNVSLIKKGFFERQRKGVYTLGEKGKKYGSFSTHLYSSMSPEELMKNIDDVKCAAEDMLKADKNDEMAKYWVYMCSVLTDDYERAYDMVWELANTKDDLLRRRMSFHLYLLDEVTGKAPDEFKSNLRESFKKSNIIIPENSSMNQMVAESTNEIRTRALFKRYRHAIKELKNLQAMTDSVTVEDWVDEKLLTEAIRKADERRHTFSDIIAKEDWETFVNYFSVRYRDHTLSKLEEYLYKLYNKYMDIKENGIIPIVEPKAPQDTFEAIDDNDFFRALNYCIEFQNQHNYAYGDSPIYLFLMKICEEITKVRITKQPREDKTKATIDEYLRLIDMNQYAFVVKDLVTVGINEGTMEKAVDTISRMGSGSYVFNVDIMVDEFKKAIKEKRIAVARSYLNIISRAEELGEAYVKAPLVSMLDELEKNEKGQVNFIKIHEALSQRRGAMLLNLGVNDMEEFISEAGLYQDIRVLKGRSSGQLVAIRNVTPLPSTNLKKLREDSRFGNLDINLALLEQDKDVEPAVFERIGRAYFSEGKYEEAVEYLNMYKAVTGVVSQEIDFIITYSERAIDQHVVVSQNKDDTGSGSNPATLRRTPKGVKNKD